MSLSAPAQRSAAGAQHATEPLGVRVVQMVGLTRTGVVVLVVAALGWVLARILGGQMLFLLVYGAVVVLVVARFLGRSRLRVHAERSELPKRLRQGQTAQVVLQVRAPRRSGLFLVEERVHPHLGRGRTVPVAGTRGGEVSFQYPITPRLRGEYQVGPLVAVWSDPFGLTRRVTELLPAATVLVHPATEAVTDRPLTRQWEDPPIRPPRSKPWPSGFEFYGMRDYVLGDDLRRVVWRAVARTGRMLTRESEQGITDHVVVVLDTDARHHSAGEVSETFEAAVRTAASLLTRHLRDGFAVTLLANSERLADAARGARARLPLLDSLARVRTTHEPLARALDLLITSGRRDTHTIVVTPHVDSEAGARLRLLSQRGGSVVLVVIASEETDPLTLRSAGSVGAQLVVLRPLTPLDAAFRVSSEVATSAVRGGS